MSRVNSDRLSRFWSLTAEAPAALASRTRCLHFSRSPWWLLPISAMTQHGPSSEIATPSIANSRPLIIASLARRACTESPQPLSPELSGAGIEVSRGALHDSRAKASLRCERHVGRGTRLRPSGLAAHDVVVEGAMQLLLLNRYQSRVVEKAQNRGGLFLEVLIDLDHHG